MTRYWVIAPYDARQPDTWEKAWEYDLQHGTIAIGWGELGNVSQMELSALQQKFQEVFPESRNLTRDCNTIWRFYNEIVPGDIVIARRGTKRAVGIGTVAGHAFYDEQKGKERVGERAEHVYPNCIPVKWEERQVDFTNIEFSFYTMYEVPEERYRTLFEAEEGGDRDGEAGMQASTEFVLERYLEDFIVTNFHAIFGDRLELYVDPQGTPGQQYPIVGEDTREIGKIDILARERNTGSYLVIELKKGRESDRVVGQILRYMGWVQENLCHQAEDVKGLIICKDEDERLRYALKALPGNIAVKFYSVSFRLSDQPA